jgi:predicted DNA-binding transcriptional regulator YafY
MPRGEQLIRHWNLLRLLQTRGTGTALSTLAGEFGVSERTIQRDLECLAELGFPLDFEEDEYGKRFWRLPHDFLRNSSLIVTLPEAVALHLAGRLFAPLSGTHFEEGMKGILAKIRTMVPEKALAYFSDLENTLQVRPFAKTDYAQIRDFVAVFDQGVRESRSIEVAYHSLWRNASYTTQYDPYGLVLHLDDLFAVGWSHRAGDTRIFKLSRVRSATLTEHTFDRPEDFDLGAFFASSFGIVQTAHDPIEVVVQFESPAAGMVQERIWHDSQRLQWLSSDPDLFEHESQDSGPLVATFKLGEVTEFKKWVKGFGEQALVLKPDWLRAEIHREFLAAAAAYASDTP